MTIDKHQERVAVAGALQLLFAAVLYGLGKQYWLEAGSYVVIQTANILLIGGLVSIVACFHAWLARGAAEERRDTEGTDPKSLFDNETDAMGQHLRAQLQFEKNILPVLLIVVSAIEFGLAYWTLRLQRNLNIAKFPVDLDALLMVSSLLAAIAVACFLFGKYCAAVAYGENRIYLRTVCGYALWSAIVCLIGSVSMLLAYWQYPDVGTTVTWILVAAALILAVERVLSWVIEFYRPQTRSREARTVYESRLLALFSHPRGVMGNLADIVEYQFGLKISERWLSIFVFRAVLPFLALQLLVLLLLTSLVYVAPHEIGMLESSRGGTYKRLEPGLHVCLPWPFAKVTRVAASRVRNVRIEPVSPEQQNVAQLDLRMWTDDRFKKEYFITAYRGDPAESTSESVPANLAVARLNVRYQVENAGTYLGAQMEPDKYVELLSRRALVHYLATHDFSESLAAGPGRIGTGLSTALGPLLAKAGIRVVAVELTSLQPPAAAASGFRLVLDAEAASERELIEARFYEAKATAEARQLDARIRAAAAVENVRLTRLAEVDRQNFDLHLEYFHKYPELYTTRVVMDAMEEWLVDVRKIVIAAESDHEVFTLELRESQPNLLDAFRSQ